MLKRYVTMLLAIMMVIVVAGCGSPKPKDTADKAILTWADLLWSGWTDNPASIGVSQSKMEEYNTRVHDYYMQVLDLGEFHLDEETQDKVITHLINEYNDKINIKTELVKDDSKNPVVKVTFTPIDMATLKRDVQNDQGVLALAEVSATFSARGIDASTDAEWNSIASQALENALTDLPMGSPESVEVTCELGKATSGDEVFWTPTDADAKKLIEAMTPDFK